MGIADRYYTDTAKVQRYQGINDRGDTIYEPEIVIPCRFSYQQKEVLDSKGQRNISTAVILCGVFIPSLSIVKDGINTSFTVQSCEPIKRIAGEIDHYEVIL